MENTKKQIQALSERLRVTIEHLQASGIRKDTQQTYSSQQSHQETDHSSLDYDYMRGGSVEDGHHRNYSQEEHHRQEQMRYADDAQYEVRNRSGDGYEPVQQDKFYHDQDTRDDLNYEWSNNQDFSSGNVGNESSYSQFSGNRRGERRNLHYTDENWEQGGQTKTLSQLDSEHRRNESQQTRFRFRRELNNDMDEYGQLEKGGVDKDMDRFQYGKDIQIGSNVYQDNSGMISYGTNDVLRNKERDEGFDRETRREHYTGHSGSRDPVGVNRNHPVVIDYNHATQTEGNSGSSVSQDHRRNVSQEQGRNSTANSISKDHLSSEYEEYMREIGLLDQIEDTGKETTNSRIDQNHLNIDNGRSHSRRGITNMHGNHSESYDSIKERNSKLSHPQNSRERNLGNDIDRMFPNKRDRQTYNNAENRGSDHVDDRNVKRQRKSRFSDLADSDTALKADSTSGNVSKGVIGHSLLQRASTSRQDDRLMGQQTGIDSIRKGMGARAPRQEGPTMKPPSRLPQHSTDSRRGDPYQDHRPYGSEPKIGDRERGRPTPNQEHGPRPYGGEPQRGAIDRRRPAPNEDHGPYGGESQGDGLLPIPTCAPLQPPLRHLNQRSVDQRDGLLQMPAMGPDMEREIFGKQNKDSESRQHIGDIRHRSAFRQDDRGEPPDGLDDMDEHLHHAPEQSRRQPHDGMPNANRKPGSGMSRGEGGKAPQRKSRFSDADDVSKKVSDYVSSLCELPVHKDGRDKPGPHDMRRDKPGPHDMGRDKLGPHDMRRDKLGPHDMGRDKLGPHDMRRDKPGPHDMGRDKLGPHNMGRDKLGPHNMGRDKLGPHNMGRDKPGPHDMGRDKLGPHNMGRDKLGPHNMGRDKPGPHDMGRDKPGPHNMGRDILGPHDMRRDKPGPHDMGRDKLGPHNMGRDKLGPHDMERDKPGPHDMGRDKPGPPNMRRHQMPQGNDIDLPDPSREEIDLLLQKAGQIVSQDRHLKKERVKGHQAAPSIPSLLDLPLPADRHPGVGGVDEDDERQPLNQGQEDLEELERMRELRAVMENARHKLGFTPDDQLPEYHQDDGLLAAPGHREYRQDGDDGLLATPRLDGLSALPRPDGLLGPPRHDGLLAPPRGDGLLAAPRQDRLPAAHRHDGLLAAPRQERLRAGPRQDGILGVPRQDGLLALPRGRGNRQDGLLATPRLDGLMATPGIALGAVWMDGNPCPVAECRGIEFESFPIFLAHWERVHTVGKKVHQCSVCEAEFLEFGGAMKHMLLHPRPGQILERIIRPPLIHPGDVQPYLPPTDLLSTQEIAPYREIEQQQGNQSSLPEFDRNVRVEGTFNPEIDYKLKFTEAEELAFQSFDQDESQHALFEKGKICPVGAKVCHHKFDTFVTFDKHWKKYHVSPIWLFHCTACSEKFRRYHFAKEHPKEHGGHCIIWSEKIGNKFFIDPGNVLRHSRKPPPT